MTIVDYFEYRNGRLFAEETDLATIAERHGTPCYVYSRRTLERHWHAFDRALAGQDHLICYSVKANSNLAVLNILSRLGSAFDVVSVGELERVIAAGGDPATVVFSGVGKSIDEMRAALAANILCFNVESEQELGCLNDVASELRVKAPVSIRVNPDVDPKTHPYIATGLKHSKFGVPMQDALDLYRRAVGMPNVEVRGVDCHIGSQLTSTSPVVDALERLLALVNELSAEGIVLEHLNLGGGLGIHYQDEIPPEPMEYARAICDRLGRPNTKLIIEPGRAISGNAGILLTRVTYLKHVQARSFAIVDAAMNDLLRPALYDAWQEIVPVEPRSGADDSVYDVVGPVCESADFLGKRRVLDIWPGDLLAVRSAGAYGFVMSSNYNSRPRPPEIMVDGDNAYLVRKRESVRDLFAGESVLPE